MAPAARAAESSAAVAPAPAMAEGWDQGWIDVSVPLHSGLPHWPGQPPFHAEPHPGGDSRTSVLRMGSHAGTHVDAPRHFLPGGAAVDQAPLEALLGPAVLVDHHGPVVGEDDVQGWRLPPGGRLLVRTDNSRRDWPERPHDTSFVGLTTAAARRLADAGLRLVGIDYLSIAAPGHARPVHEALLGAGCWIAEGLDLRGLPAGPCDVVCLPLRVRGGDGAPARVLLRSRAVADSRRRSDGPAASG